MKQNSYIRKVKLFKNIDLDKTLILDEQNQNYSKRQLIKLSQDIANIIKDKNLVLFCCENTSENLAYYYAFIKNKQALILCENNNEIDHLIKKFNPEFIFLRKEKENVNNYYMIKEGINFKILKNKKKIKKKIHKDLAILITTSGSLKESKYVKLSYENIFENAISISKYLKIKINDISITTLPLSYSYGMSVCNSHLFFDKTIVCSKESFIERNFWEKVKKYCITNISFVPFNLETLNKLGLHKFDFSKVRFITLAGGKLNSSIVVNICNFFKSKKINFYSMYGQTEASPRISFIELKTLLKKPLSCGKAIPGGTITIENKNKKKNYGEIVYKGKNIFKGYAQNRKDCYSLKNYYKLYTGDLGYKDINGDLFIIGRKKREIKAYGVRINLDILENEINKKSSSFICTNSENNLKIFYSKKNLNINKTSQTIRTLTNLRNNDIQFIYIKKFPRLKNNKINYKMLKNF